MAPFLATNNFSTNKHIGNENGALFNTFHHNFLARGEFIVRFKTFLLKLSWKFYKVLKSTVIFFTDYILLGKCQKFSRQLRTIFTPKTFLSAPSSVVLYSTEAATTHAQQFPSGTIRVFGVIQQRNLCFLFYN